MLKIDICDKCNVVVLRSCDVYSDVRRYACDTLSEILAKHGRIVRVSIDDLIDRGLLDVNTQTSRISTLYRALTYDHTGDQPIIIILIDLITEHEFDVASSLGARIVDVDQLVCISSHTPISKSNIQPWRTRKYGSDHNKHITSTEWIY